MGDQRGLPKKSNRLFMCQDENENEPEDVSFRSFWIKPVTNRPSHISFILKLNANFCALKK